MFDVVVAKDKEIGGYHAEHISRHSQIRINNTLRRDHQERAFLEEILHAIFYESGNYKKNEDEVFVHTLSSMLYTVLTENKLWFGYEKDRKKRKRVVKSPSKAN